MLLLGAESQENLFWLRLVVRLFTVGSLRYRIQRVYITKEAAILESVVPIKPPFDASKVEISYLAT